MAGDCCVFKFLRRSVNGKHLMRFPDESAVYKFLRRNVGGTWECTYLPWRYFTSGFSSNGQEKAQCHGICHSTVMKKNIYHPFYIITPKIISFSFNEIVARSVHTASRLPCSQVRLHYWLVPRLQYFASVNRFQVTRTRLRYVTEINWPWRPGRTQ